MYYIVKEYGPGIHRAPKLEFMSRPLPTKEVAENNFDWFQSQTKKKCWIIFVEDHPEGKCI